MSIARITLALAASLFVAGCITTESPPPADDPFPANYRQLILANKADLFKDPDSARDASIAPPKRASGPSLTPAGFITPWIVCLNVNAKNSFGAYTGKQRMAVLMSKGAIVDTKGSTEHAALWCSEHQGYEPFPELTAKARG